MEFRTTDSTPIPSGAGREPQGNHPAAKVQTKPLRTCERTRGEGRERDEDLSSPVSFSQYYSPSPRSGVLWLSQSGEFVIVPRVQAETTENVFQVRWFRQSGNGRQLLGPALAKRWVFDAEKFPSTW